MNQKTTKLLQDIADHTFTKYAVLLDGHLFARPRLPPLYQISRKEHMSNSAN